MREKMLRMTGGRIRQPGSGKGFFAIVNCQTNVSEKEFQELAKGISFNERIDVRVMPGKKVDGVDYSQSLSSIGAGLAAFVINDPSMKSRLLLAPEDGWGVVNVAALALDKPAEMVLKKRARIETMRAFALLMGGVGSQYQGNMLDPIRSSRDLEMYLEELPVDVTGKFGKYAEKFGIKPYRDTYYRTAVEEGWAPKPANKYQQAAWDRVHKMPTDPIRIKPETKK
jgi:hypothetical protein